MLRSLVLIILVFIGINTYAQPVKTSLNVSEAPFLNNGAKWKFAYVETGPYSNYSGTLYYILKALEAKGWVKGVKDVPYKWGQLDTSDMWKHISTSKGFSDYIDFLPNDYYSIKAMNLQESKVVARFTDPKVADVIIVMGTVVGKLLSTEETKSKVFVFSASNAVTSNISKEVYSSGKPNVWAHMDTIRYTQQLEFFIDTFKIKKLGFVYEDTPNGKAFAALADILSVTSKKKVKPVFRILKGANTQAERDQYFLDLLKVHTELSSEVDGFYYAISPAPGLKLEHLYSVLLPFYDKGIPVFSQLGEIEVKNGALMSISKSEFTGTGKFGVQTIIAALKGADMSKLPQEYNETIQLAINLDVARKIKYTPSFSTLALAQKTFSNVGILTDKR